MTVGLVALGGALGSVLRAYTSHWMGASAANGQIPWGTFTVNLVGTAVLACVVAWGLKGAGPSQEMRALIATGFCGGLTTFSTFSVETLNLWTAGSRGTALSYLGLSLVASFAVIALIWSLWSVVEA